jgi:hypothetical protein
MGVPESEFTDSLEVLTSRRFLKNTWAHNGPMQSIFDVTLTAFEEYLRHGYPDYVGVSRAVAAEAANSRQALNHDIKQTLNLPLAIVDHILFMLERQGKLRLSKSMPNFVRVMTVSVDLKRELRQ